MPSTGILATLFALKNRANQTAITNGRKSIQQSYYKLYKSKHLKGQLGARVSHEK